MKQRFIDVLENCILMLNAGVSLENCLKEYPEYAPELSKLLKTAAMVKNLRVENIPTRAKEQNQAELLSFAENLRSGNKIRDNSSSIDWLMINLKRIFQSSRIINPIASRLALALGIATIFIILSGGILITSAKSLPGDSLYPVKRAVEDITYYLAPSDELRHEYEDGYKQKRVDEVIKLIGLTREQKISFEGIVTSLDDSQWIVSGIPVIVQPKTLVVAGTDGRGTIEPGMRVEVEGNTGSQGQVYADEIHLREYQFIGVVEKINPRNWKISGTTLSISTNTQIDSGIRVGDTVTGLIRSDDDGLYALAILGELHSTSFPERHQSLMTTPTPFDHTTIETGFEEFFNGTLDQVNASYWVVNAEIFYIVNDTQIENGINIGDYISVEYKIEQNGSFTATEIMRIDDDEETEDRDVQEITEPSEESEDRGSSTYEPNEVEETKESTQPEEHGGTPEITETPLNP